MVKRIAQIAGVTLLLGGVFVPTAHADTHFSLQIGAPVPFAPGAVAPRGYVWQPGYRVWTGFGYRWIPGAWVPAPYVRGYGAPEWRERGRGDWDRDRRGDWDRDRRGDWDRDRRGDWNRDRRGSWDRDRRERDRDERDWRR